LNIQVVIVRSFLRYHAVWAMANVTIYDVAKAAGVSIATVSRVLNTPQQVQEQTRQRVQTAIEQLNFVPRAEASARARRSHGRIGVLAPFFTYPSFVQRLRGVASVLDGSAYELVVYNVDTPAHCRQYLENLPLSRRLDGLLIMSISIDDQVAQRFIQQELPVVLLETAHSAFSSIIIDHVAGGRLAADYLLAKGYRQVAFIGGDSEIPGYTVHTSELRLTGYRAALQEAGVFLPAQRVRMTQNSMEQARLQADALLALPEPPTAIFAGSDTLALGVLKAARQRNLNIPGDVAIIGFDDLDIADYIGLTTIDQSLDESGRVAVELLLTRIAEPARSVQHVRLPLREKPRETA
jgi:DNA-binding LacI/PurR family transcriptional regulator